MRYIGTALTRVVPTVWCSNLAQYCAEVISGEANIDIKAVRILGNYVDLMSASPGFRSNPLTVPAIASSDLNAITSKMMRHHYAYWIIRASECGGLEIRWVWTCLLGQTAIGQSYVMIDAREPDLFAGGVLLRISSIVDAHYACAEASPESEPPGFVQEESSSAEGRGVAGIDRVPGIYWLNILRYDAITSDYLKALVASPAWDIQEREAPGGRLVEFRWRAGDADLTDRPGAAWTPRLRG